MHKNEQRTKREAAAVPPPHPTAALPPPPARDERTDAAIGLDETVAWLRDRGVADRMPEGPASQVAPSSAAAAASELGRRIEPTVHPFWDRPTPRQSLDSTALKQLFVQLPRVILDYRPSRKHLNDLRALIDLAREAALDEIATPTPSPPSPPPRPRAAIELELARGYRVEDLLADPEAHAAGMIARAMQVRRGDEIFARLLHEYNNGRLDSILARRCRSLLAGEPTIASDAKHDARTLWPELPPAMPSRSLGADIPDRVHALVGPIARTVAVSLTPPTNLPPGIALDRELLELQRARDNRTILPKPVFSPNASAEDRQVATINHAAACDRAYVTREAELRRETSARNGHRSNAVILHFDALRVRVLEALRAALGPLELGRLPWFYVREAYLALLHDAQHPTELRGHLSVPADAGDYARVALERAFMLGVDVARVAP
jgi:hypothetical protein